MFRPFKQRSSSGYICYKLKSLINTKCYYGYNVKICEKKRKVVVTTKIQLGNKS